MGSASIIYYSTDIDLAKAQGQALVVILINVIRQNINLKPLQRNLSNRLITLRTVDHSF